MRETPMTSESDAPSTAFTVEVKHGKEKLEVPVGSSEVTVAWLMEHLESCTGVLRKHQKLICKGKVLEAKRSVAEQAVKGGAVKPGGRVTVMLMASAGGGGAAPPPQTAGQVALQASRAAKAAKLKADAIATGLGGASGRNDDGARRADASAAARRAAWAKTGIVGLRRAAVDEIPEEVFAMGEAVRVADFFGNRIRELPPAVAALAAVTRIRLADNRLTSSNVAWEALCALPNLAVLALDNNALAGPLPECVGNLRKLEALSLDGNQLTALPPTVAGLVNLERLSVAKNKLRALPPELASCSRLDTVDATHNLLAAIPESFATAPRLRALLLNHNRITLDGVPAAVLALSPAGTGVNARYTPPLILSATRHV